MVQINRIEEIDTLFENNTIVLFYFSTPTCNVCKALLPKVENLLENFPEIEKRYIDMTRFKELSGKFSIFNFPTILVFIDKKETIRKSRFISIPELESLLTRYYSFIYQ